MTTIIELTQENRKDAPLYWNFRNQLRRALGRFEVVYCGGGFGGTVRDWEGKCWDWWVPGEQHWKNGGRVVVIPAR